MLDIRFLSRRKVLTVIAVLTMGLAIGAATASLSVLKAFLVSSLAVPDAERVVVVQPARNLPGRGAVHRVIKTTCAERCADHGGQHHG